MCETCSICLFPVPYTFKCKHTPYDFQIAEELLYFGAHLNDLPRQLIEQKKHPSGD